MNAPKQHKPRKPTVFTFYFDATPNWWTARAGVNESSPFIFLRVPPFRKRQTSPRVAVTTTGQKETEQRWRRVYYQGASDAKSFDEFIVCFVEATQTATLWRAAAYGDLFVPSNMLEVYWTPPFIARLAGALKRPRERENHEYLIPFLIGAWEDGTFNLCEMDRKQLSNTIKKEFGLALPPNTVWQMAYRAGLLSKRTSGPKSRVCIK